MSRPDAVADAGCHWMPTANQSSLTELDGLDDAVQGRRRRPEAAGHALDRPPMLAVDDDLALAVDVGQSGAGDDVDGVTQAAFGRMAVLQRLRPFPADVLEERAVVGRVQGVQEDDESVVT